MQAIINFLKDLETLAGELYRKSCRYFSGPPAWVGFLKELSKDEELHLKIITNVLQRMKQHKLEVGEEIILDEEIRSHLQNLFQRCLKELENQTLSREQLLLAIIDAEYSEWNDVFLYVIGSLVKKDADFRYITAKLQDHLKSIEKFILALEDNELYLPRFTEINRVWDNQVLVVEDNANIRMLLQRLLEKKYKVMVAADGMAAYETVKQQYFDLIVSDIDLPGLNGIQLLDRLQAEGINLAGKIVFISGKEEYREELAERGIPFLRKPFSLNRLRKIAEEILLQTGKRENTRDAEE